MSHAQPPFPYRRRFQARHRRRGLLATMARPFLAAAALVAAPVALALWVATSPRFHLHRLEVAGTPRVPEAWVEKALRPLVERHLLWLSLAAVERRLTVHPWVATVEMRKQLPDRLHVEIVERRPAALLRRDGELFYLDSEGEIIAPFESNRPEDGEADLLVLSAASGARVAPLDALDLAAELARVERAWAEGLAQVEFLGEGGFRLDTATLPFPLLVEAGTVAASGRHLRRLLPDILRRYDRVAAVDLRFDRRIVIQPEAEDDLVPRRKRD